MHAMAKDRHKRFRSVADMAQALGYRGDVPSPGPSMPDRPEGTLARVSSWLRRPPKPAAPVPLAQLVITAGSAYGKRVPLTPGVTSLRRRDIDPTDGEISREHARIIQQGDQFWLEDLNSTNGTFLNGQRIVTPTMLHPGDQIRIGHCVLQFHVGTQ